MGGTSHGSGITLDLMVLLSQLLPGLLAAWIFYSLTAFQRPSPFERIVQALVFTMIVHVGCLIVEKACRYIGEIWQPFFVWTKDSSVIWSAIIALLVGFAFSVSANKNWMHTFLREKLNWTNRESFPSEWYSVHQRCCHDEKREAILHFDDGRRLRGKVENWPDDPNEGSYSLAGARWIRVGEDDLVLTTVARIVVHSKDVNMIEFLKTPEEFAAEYPKPTAPTGDHDVIEGTRTG